MEPRIFRAGPLSTGTEVTLTGTPAAHIGKVLRLREGDRLILFNDSGLDHPAQITSLDRQRVVVQVEEGYDPGTESPLQFLLTENTFTFPVVPSSILATLAVITIVTLASAYMPARKAAKLDPAVALRTTY